MELHDCCHHNQNAECVHHPQKPPYGPLWSVLTPCPQPLTATHLFPISAVLAAVFEMCRKEAIYILDSKANVTYKNLQTLTYPSVQEV